MNNLTNPLRNAIGDRVGAESQQFPASPYLDHRHCNWIISEDMGDVLFGAEAGIVLVHRVRAEHIARTLGWAGRVTAPATLLVPLDDVALALAAALVPRAGRLPLDVDS